VRSHFLRVTIVATVAAFLPVVPLAASPAYATDFGTGTGVSYTLEGCRASVDAYIDPANTFICKNNGDYTTGNLGTGWNEFDKVPGRVTVAAGNSAPSTQDFRFAIAVDNCSANTGSAGCPLPARPGYDRLSSDIGGTPTLNAGLSSSSAACGSISASDARYAPPDTSAGATPAAIGGTGTSLYRIITITGQATNSTCVYDFYARLAFNSHLYPGSSLHFDLANDQLGTGGIGAKDVSIPVKGILPPTLSKTQTSSQGSNVVWSVKKTASPTSFSFGETCPASNEPQSHGVVVTVSWTKRTIPSGDIVVQAILSLTNNAHLALPVSVSDQLYTGGLDASGNPVGSPIGSPIRTPLTGTVSLAAGESTSFTDTFTVTSGTAFSDKATETFYDPDDPTVVLGTLSATATSNLQTLDPLSGATAVVTDTESMTGSTDYDFTVDSVVPGTGGVAGSFGVNYNVGTHQHTRGPLVWNSGSVSGSGTTTFNKSVYVNHPTTGTATLADTATVTPDGQEASSTPEATSVFTSNATVALTINKTIPVVLGAGDATETFTFPVTGPSSASPTITFGQGDGGVLHPKSVTLTGLAPGTYTVNETTLPPYQAQVSHSVPINLPSCSGSTTFTNNFGPARAQARKVTVPAGSEAGWDLTLTGPGTPVGGELKTTTGTSYVLFATVLQEGSYTITETPQPGWDQTGASAECSFTVNYPADADRPFQCTLTNTQRGSITIIKDAVPDDPQPFGYTTTGTGLSPFTLVDNGDPTTARRTFTNLVPGAYSVTETLPVTGWDLTGLRCTSTNGSSTLGTTLATGLATIGLGAGDSVTCTYTNTKRGHVTVRKTENGAVPTTAYTFRLTGGPDSVSITRTTDGINLGNLDFGLLKPGTYTLCELAVPAGTHSTLQDQGGIVDATTGDVCLTFALAPGEPRNFNIDNSRPGGGQRTIGYWKNWNSCSGTGNDRVAMAAKTGNHLMDEFLPKSLGNYVVDTCAKGLAVLKAASGKYAENQLAAQLLGAKLNIAAGASTCPTVNNAIAHADALLVQIGYVGPPSAIVGSTHPLRTDFVNTATVLDNYNNGLIC
jgi:hypothetical protein